MTLLVVIPQQVLTLSQVKMMAKRFFSLDRESTGVFGGFYKEIFSDASFKHMKHLHSLS